MASHQEHLSTLIRESLHSLPAVDAGDDESGSVGTVNVQMRNGQWLTKRRPDFISVTRGPGITAALTTGLDTAKGLAVAWQIPLIGVHHMQAHALTPRLVHSMQQHLEDDDARVKPGFPFLTLLVSGGHTLLVHTRSLYDHSILASTADIAIGDAIDKMARSIIPPAKLNGNEIMYGRILEKYAFHDDARDYQYSAPTSRAEEIAKRVSQWDWAIPVPLTEGKDMKFSFSGLESAIKRICERQGSNMDQMERREMAREAMRVAFEHLAMRIIWALEKLEDNGQQLTNVVVSGGVASNGFLRNMYTCPGKIRAVHSLMLLHSLRSFLDARGFRNVRLVFPPVELCTDNAAMIAWAGTEMFRDGWMTDLGCKAMRKWSLDPQAEDGGIMGASGWRRRTVDPPG